MGRFHRVLPDLTEVVMENTRSFVVIVENYI